MMQMKGLIGIQASPRVPVICHFAMLRTLLRSHPDRRLMCAQKKYFTLANRAWQ